MVGRGGLREISVLARARHADGGRPMVRPAQAMRGSVRFPAFDAAPPVRLEDLAKQPIDVFPSKSRLVNVATLAPDLKIDLADGVDAKAIRRGPQLWALTFHAPRLSPSRPQALRLTAGGSVATINLRAAPVPLTAYGVNRDVMTNITGADPSGVQVHAAIDSSKPADVGGGPATTIVWMVNGDISHREVGRHGFVLPRWRGDNPPRRQIKAPFADSFTDLKIETASFGRIHWDVDGEKAETPGKTVMYGSVAENRAGSAFSIPIRPTDAEVHLLTIVVDKRADHRGPPAEFTVIDPATKRAWRVADLDGSQGCAVLQFRFAGPIDIAVAATAKSDEGYNKANISALFLN